MHQELDNNCRRHRNDFYIEKKSVFVIHNHNDFLSFLSLPDVSKVIIFHKDNFTFSPVEGLKHIDTDISWDFLVRVSDVPIATLLINNDEYLKCLDRMLPGLKHQTFDTPVLALINEIVIWKSIVTPYDILSHTLLLPVNCLSVVEKDTIFYIGASFCPPCQKIMKRIPELRDEFKKFDFCKIDYDASPDLVRTFKVDKIPTFCFVRKGSNTPLFSYQNSDYDLVKQKLIEWLSMHVIEITDDF